MANYASTQRKIKELISVSLEDIAALMVDLETERDDLQAELTDSEGDVERLENELAVIQSEADNAKDG
jgi:predicted  nucleic acid-binding Zn-ribbon protein